MESTEKTHKTDEDALLRKLFGEYEFNRYGIISMILIAVVCLGGVGVALGGLSSAVVLALLLIPTMATLTFILAVAPMRWILYTALASMAISSIVIIYYILV